MSKFRTALLLSAAMGMQAVAAATITTRISADEISLGTSAQLQISVEGTTNIVLPATLPADGLQIRRAGEQVRTNFDFGTGVMSASGVYFYTIIPLREGTFEIPAIEVTVDGRKQKTAPKKLVVTTGTAPARPYSTPGAPSGPIPPPTTDDAEDRVAFARLVIPKREIYVGEVVPVEVQIFIANDNRNPRTLVGFKPLRDPQVSGEGFTTQKLGPAVRSEEMVGSTRYVVLTFKTTISPVKSGEAKTPVASLDCMLSFAVNDPGMGSIFGGSMGLVENKETTLKSESQPIRVKALPAQGRPAGFSGAVGDFTIAATAQPEKVSAGDPVTLKVAISGRGNFDAIDDPKLVAADGWRLYPPTSRFEKADDVGYGGTKTFEIPMVAQQPQTRTPVAEFSYFDPDKTKYFTIRSQPVTVDAAAAPAATAAVPAAQPTATPTPEPGGEWLAQTTKRSWQPLFKWPGFWILNGSAALALAGLAGGLLIRRRRAGPAAQRAAVARRRDRIVSELGRQNLSDEIFCERALEALALQAGLAGESGPFELVRSLQSHGRNTDDLQTVLGRADEIKFSGGTLATRLDAGERSRIATAVREACR